MSPPRAIVVEDEALIALMLCDLLEELGLIVCGVAATAAEAIRLAAEHAPELVLMDVRLKGPSDGVEAAIEIHRIAKPVIIFLTGSREPETVQRIESDHPSAILFKPVEPDDLMRTIAAALG